MSDTTAEATVADGEATAVAPQIPVGDGVVMSARERLIAEALKVYGGGADAAGEADAGDEASGGGAAAAEPAAAVAKPKAARNQIEFQLRMVNPYIVCTLCAGYFISATTIVECLHTFCKSCIVNHFASNNTCPTCSIVVHETNPFEKIKPDRTIQAVVYKIVKGLAKDEEARVAKFNEGRGEKRPAPSVAEIASAAAAAAVSRPEAKARKVEVDDQISFVLELYDPAEEQKEAASEDEKVTNLEKPFIRTSARATVTHLKKFLAKKLDLQGPDDVDILCRGEVLGREFTLEFIAKTRWRTPQVRDQQLVLKYRPKVDFDPA